jgi:hypothetical protein
MRKHNARPTTPLASYFAHQKWNLVKPADISATLRLAAGILGPGPGLGLSPQDVSAQSMCASGTMALLCTHVDTDIIKLLGHWWSNEMLCYLPIQAKQTHHHAQLCLQDTKSWKLCPHDGPQS